MIVFPKGTLRKHLEQNGKWWLLFFTVDIQALDEQVRHAKKHHPEEDVEQLKERALFRMGARKSFPWKALAIIALLLLAAKSFAQVQPVNIDRVGGVKVTTAVPVSGTVTSTPSGTQAVSSTQLPASLDLSGNLKVSVQNATIAVTQSTSPWVVSGTVAATQSGTWTVQPGNTANTTAWKVDGSAVTQPISGSISNSSFASTQGTSPWVTQEAGSGTVLSGQQAVTGTAAALATNSAKKACVKALSANTINIYVGPSGITTSTGFELTPGSAVCLPVTNTNLVYVVASTTGASAAWLATN